jgi:methylated-DNA-[protein]-cysteine S-methyltransferase
MAVQEDLTAAVFETPLGTLVATATPIGLRAAAFELELLADARQEPGPALDALGRWLSAYFAKAWDALEPLPIDAPVAPLDVAVREKLLAIKPGRSTTYGELARQVGKPNAARAVGAAVGRNPLLLVVPCHRVLASNGSLAGFSGGATRKAWLLRHEGVLLL